MHLPLRQIQSREEPILASTDHELCKACRQHSAVIVSLHKIRLPEYILSSIGPIRLCKSTEMLAFAVDMLFLQAVFPCLSRAPFVLRCTVVFNLLRCFPAGVWRNSRWQCFSDNFVRLDSVTRSFWSSAMIARSLHLCARHPSCLSIPM